MSQGYIDGLDNSLIRNKQNLQLSYNNKYFMYL